MTGMPLEPLRANVAPNLPAGFRRRGFRGDMINRASAHRPPIARGRVYQVSIVEFFGRATYWYLVLHARPQMLDIVCGMN